MNLSIVAVDLIAEFEGLRLDAYLDPAGVPTIGYGTTRYPDGRRVHLGESISEAEAEALLRGECEAVANEITRLTDGIDLNQNQFDALVSFSYNVGIGAFAGSTLLKRLRQGDVAGAAAELDRWNKATVGGVKKVLEGLTRRRARERALFEKATRSRARAAQPLVGQAAPDRTVRTATAYDDNGTTVVVLTDEAGSTVDIVALADSQPASLVRLLDQYAELDRFTVAGAGAAIPVGERRSFSGLARPVRAAAAVPVLNTTPYLARGAVDSEGSPGNDVQEMQTRLIELGYYHNAVTGSFDSATDEAVKSFQIDHFGPKEGDGKVGTKTWGALFPSSPPRLVTTGPAVAGRNYLHLTNTGEKDPRGLNVLLLEYVKDGVGIDSLEVCSGSHRHQVFRIGRDSQRGSFEPLPEGRWFIHDMEWAAGKDVYLSKVWDSGLGPVKIRLDYQGPGTTAREAIEFHIDWNQSGSPGTAGCVGLRCIADFRVLAGWLRETDPRDLFVDWGLGTCPTP